MAYKYWPVFALYLHCIESTVSIHCKYSAKTGQYIYAIFPVQLYVHFIYYFYDVKFIRHGIMSLNISRNYKRQYVASYIHSSVVYKTQDIATYCFKILYL